MNTQVNKKNMFDKQSGTHIRIELSKDKKYWNRYTSKDNINWELDKKLHSLSEVLLSQQEIIDNNNVLFYNMIISKKKC